ncbi:MAG: hypothetical protein EB060_05400 [Proteobacteria bacterium]|nr:hypothetical protein [Pseudomonadota bacterium]
MIGKNTLKMADQEVAVIILCKGQSMEGKPYYAYLQIVPSKIAAFKAAQQKGDFLLEEYGTILKWEFAEAPSEQVKRDMEIVYGVNHHLEQDCKTKIAELPDNQQ